MIQIACEIAAFVASLGIISDTLPCTCPAESQPRLHWCCGCREGIAYGVAIRSRGLFRLLRGRTVTDGKRLECNTCQQAWSADGDCTACRWYFHWGRRYRSVFARDLARATAGETDSAARGTSASAPSKPGTRAAAARIVLSRAAGMGCRCERCAIAAMTDGDCRKCRITFEGGTGKPWGT